MTDPICHEVYQQRLKADLIAAGTPAKAKASLRYLPDGQNCIGATAADIKSVIKRFQSDHPQLSADDMLAITELILQKAKFSEEVLLAFGLINKFVKRHYGDDLLLRFEFWLENYATNWAHVDDLCIKTIYLYFLARPHLIENTRHWTNSKSPWCRRASNVVWVKFINRKIGKSTYCLNKELAFKQCDVLMSDHDEFVQKSIGWLLKVMSLHHQQEVVSYIRANHDRMQRLTLRYAIEKMPTDLRKQLLAKGK